MVEWLTDWDCSSLLPDAVWMLCSIFNWFRIHLLFSHLSKILSHSDKSYGSHFRFSSSVPRSPTAQATAIPINAKSSRCCWRWVGMKYSACFIIQRNLYILLNNCWFGSKLAQLGKSLEHFWNLDKQSGHGTSQQPDGVGYSAGNPRQVV